MKSKIDLAAIRARCDAATPGPWEYKASTLHSPYNFIIYSNHEMIGEAAVVENTDFIAHARQDIPALLDEIDAITNSRDFFVNLHEIHVEDKKQMSDEIDRLTRENESLIKRLNDEKRQLNSHGGHMGEFPEYMGQEIPWEEMGR
jgi:hypothetical protein